MNKETNQGSSFQNRLAMFNKKPEAETKKEIKVVKKEPESTQSVNNKTFQTNNTNQASSTNSTTITNDLPQTTNKQEEVKPLNIMAKRYTRKNLKGESYHVYKAFDLSQKEAIPVPKSLPLLKTFVKGLLGNILKKASQSEENESNQMNKEIETSKISIFKYFR